jgi:hypothetical protein
MFPGFFSVCPYEKHNTNMNNDRRYSFKLEQDNVTLRRVRATIVAVEKQELLHTP